MDILPLPKRFWDKLVEIEATTLEIRFQGGNDEGFCECEINAKDSAKANALADKIHEWALDSYEYSGAGDGNDYGDDIYYDLKAGTVTHTDWCMERTELTNDPTPILIEETEEE